MERKEAIRSAYRLTGSSSFYDGMMTCSTLPGRLVCRLDYDFSLADKDAAMHSGVIARTIVLDRLVGEYLAAHPGATVMNLACGLDTRCYRMQGYAHWYNLDLSETIAVREALLPESGSISQLAMSVMDDWGSEVKEPSGPALVIIEGLTMYLTQAAALNAAFDARLQALRADNAAAGKEKLPSGKADPARHRSL